MFRGWSHARIVPISRVRVCNDRTKRSGLYTFLRSLSFATVTVLLDYLVSRNPIRSTKNQTCFVLRFFLPSFFFDTVTRSRNRSVLISVWTRSAASTAVHAWHLSNNSSHEIILTSLAAYWRKERIGVSGQTVKHDAITGATVESIVRKCTRSASSSLKRRGASFCRLSFLLNLPRH